MDNNENTNNPITEETSPETATAPVEESVAEESAAEESFAEMLAAESVSFDEGDVVKGTIIDMNDDYVTVDIGYKSEGAISINEFKRGGEIEISIGDTIDVFIENKEDENGYVVLSKEKADRMKVWDKISDIAEADETIEGKIIGRVKGGLSVDIGVKAFLPGSQVDLRPVRNLDSLVGQNFTFKIIKFNKARGNIVLSRRILLERERRELKDKTLTNLEDEKVVEGIVKNITEYGVFIDLGGIDGLLHITDMSWGRINHPSEMFSIGDEVKVKVLNFDRDKERVSLGLKQITPDPWANVGEKYPPGNTVSGKVVSLTDYGAFVEIEEGVEGLIHVSEMSWTKRVKHPSKVLSLGEIVEAMVLNVDADNKRISLGLRQTEENPWETIEQKYPPGTIIEAPIRNLTDFGIFVGIEDGIDGLIHISDISWTKKINHPNEMFKKGQYVKAVVLSIDKENQRFSLGIKQMEEDPWKRIHDVHRVGDIVKVKIVSVTDFGVFVELKDGIEGLIHVSELSKERIEDPKKLFKVGDPLMAQVISIDAHEKKISLSAQAVMENEEAVEYAEFLDRQNSKSATLGDLLSKKLGQKAEEASAEEAATEEAATEEEPAAEAEAETKEEPEAEADAQEDAEPEADVEE